MIRILILLQSRTDFVAFAELFELNEGRSGVVVSFIAMLELIKEGLIECMQTAFNSPVYVRLAVKRDEQQSEF